jgi:hypothetical protein
VIDVFVVPEMAGQTVAVTGTKAAERFVLSSKFGGSYSIVLKALSGADQIPSFTLDGSAELVMGDGSDRVTLEAQALTADLGKGDDELVGNGKNGCEVKGGPGEDTIRCSGETVVIDGGTGNDTITSAFAGFGFALNGGPGRQDLRQRPCRRGQGCRGRRRRPDRDRHHRQQLQQQPPHLRRRRR